MIGPEFARGLATLFTVAIAGAFALMVLAVVQILLLAAAVFVAVPTWLFLLPLAAAVISFVAVLWLVE